MPRFCSVSAQRLGRILRVNSGVVGTAVLYYIVVGQPSASLWVLGFEFIDG